MRERKEREGKIGERGRIRGKPTSIELVALLGPITQEKIEEKGRGERGKNPWQSSWLCQVLSLERKKREKKEMEQKERITLLFGLLSIVKFS